jgi:hypothetical protein
MNRLKTVKINDFNKLIQLEELNLKKNLIETIDQYSFRSNLKLKSLNLQSNSITNINSNTFNRLNALWSLDLLKNPLKTIDPFGFYDTSIKKIFITMPNISVENMLSLKKSLKPKKVKKYLNYEYYDSIFVENRVDIQCEKTFSLIKSKIFYNFLYEYDMINFLNDCTVNSQFKLYNKYDTEYTTQSASVSNLKTLSAFIQISIYLLIFLFSMIVVGVLRLISLFLCSI